MVSKEPRRYSRSGAENLKVKHQHRRALPGNNGCECAPSGDPRFWKPLKTAVKKKQISRVTRHDSIVSAVCNQTLFWHHSERESILQAAPTLAF